ncbi:acyltransferase domain-containing protein [Oxalobacteraceae bacterium]|nr:acyltransferase domain-containing protein [Oxalobacteraceae bacterium]
MRSKLLILCPGQGGQHADMFALACSDPRAAALIDQLQLPAMPEPQALFSNRLAQPLIVASTLATWEALRTTLPRPALVAGYSVGELAAYGVAGALTPRQAVVLAQTRAQLMDNCLSHAPGQALLALSGLTLENIAALLQVYDYAIAIETGADSCVAGGPLSTLAPLQRALEGAGARCQRLPVEVAAHTCAMAPAVAPFAAALDQSDFAPMLAPVVAGIGASPVTDTAQAIDTLSRQLSEKIIWMSCMDACAESGITVALELGPGAALARMLQSRHPHIACRSVADFKTLQGVRGWVERHYA